MDLLNKICLDLTLDRTTIVRKYLLPEILKENSFENVDKTLLSDVFNILERDDVLQLQSSIEEILGEFDVDEFLETDWKIGTCTNCQFTKSVLKCKKEHDEECEYGEITSPEGCLQLFCENCIYHICENNCNAVRCETCSNV